MKKKKFIQLGGSKSPIAYCHYHKMTLSKTQMESKGCLEKQCNRLQKYDCEYWRQYIKKKEQSKQRREEKKKKQKEEDRQFDKRRLMQAIKYCRQCPLCKKDALDYCSECPYGTKCMAGIMDEVYEYFLKYDKDFNNDNQ